ncbi:MAG: hypothetical protein V4620_05645 [Bacteroidota bacterium]
MHHTKVGVCWPDEKAGRASGLRAEAFFRLAFLDTFLAMQKVSKQEIKKPYHVKDTAI